MRRYPKIGHGHAHGHDWLLPTALLSAVYGLIHENLNVRESADLLEQKIGE